MALTNAERQAAFKARKAETLEALAQQNAAYCRRFLNCGQRLTA